MVEAETRKPLLVLMPHGMSEATALRGLRVLDEVLDPYFPSFVDTRSPLFVDQERYERNPQAFRDYWVHPAQDSYALLGREILRLREQLAAARREALVLLGDRPVREPAGQTPEVVLVPDWMTMDEAEAAVNMLHAAGQLPAAEAGRLFVPREVWTSGMGGMAGPLGGPLDLAAISPARERSRDYAGGEISHGGLMMSGNIITSILRTGAQAVMGALVAWLIARGVDVPPGTGDQVVVAMVSGGVIAYTALVRWLETRESAGLRFLGRLLMLGLQAQPVYHQPEEMRRGGQGGVSG